MKKALLFGAEQYITYVEFIEKSTGTIDAIRAMDKARNSAYYGAKIGI